MRTRVKVCCIQSETEAALAVALGADALGLVAAMPSGPGPIPDMQIAAVARSAPPGIATFLLTAEVQAEAIVDHLRRTGAGVVQIVNHIEVDESARLARLIPFTPRVQVIHVEGADALALIDRYSPHVSAFLLDSGRPGEAVPELGGTGRVHDWSISAAFVRKSPLPVFLAGGLNSANIADAIRTVRPFGVDLCSGARAHGVLDQAKLGAFMAAVAAADRA